MVPELAGVWVAGLAAARRKPPPVEVAWGLRVDERGAHTAVLTVREWMERMGAGAAS
ncbi:hypothetical protein [Kitasatospora mediocidica]|uniref:hypothetical protein n=1 Tax=Kitasatospora mediocidica TaxID=58352 RepID=UPI000A9014BC|nr:hypothetical protein [Kitasatospora mediocidica]